MLDLCSHFDRNSEVDIAHLFADMFLNTLNVQDGKKNIICEKMLDQTIGTPLQRLITF